MVFIEKRVVLLQGPCQPSRRASANNHNPFITRRLKQLFCAFWEREHCLGYPFVLDFRRILSLCYKTVRFENINNPHHHVGGSAGQLKRGRPSGEDEGFRAIPFVLVKYYCFGGIVGFLGGSKQGLR
jgi:hypothetical protein